MKTLLKISVIISLFGLAPLLGQSAEPRVSPYRAGEIQADVFASVTTPNAENYQEGYGVGLSYFPWRHFGFSVRGFHQTGFDFHEQTIGNTSLRGVARLPINDSAFCPYMYVGFGYNIAAKERLEPVPGKLGKYQRRGADDWHIDAGVGMEWRFYKSISAFAEVGMQPTTQGRNEFLGSAGMRFTFGGK